MDPVNTEETPVVETPSEAPVVDPTVETPAPETPAEVPTEPVVELAD